MVCAPMPLVAGPLSSRQTPGWAESRDDPRHSTRALGRSIRRRRRPAGLLQHEVRVAVEDVVGPVLVALPNRGATTLYGRADAFAGEDGRVEGLRELHRSRIAHWPVGADEVRYAASHEGFGERNTLP